MKQKPANEACQCRGSMDSDFSAWWINHCLETLSQRTWGLRFSRGFLLARHSNSCPSMTNWKTASRFFLDLLPLSTRGFQPAHYYPQLRLKKIVPCDIQCEVAAFQFPEMVHHGCSYDAEKCLRDPRPLDCCDSKVCCKIQSPYPGGQGLLLGGYHMP